MIQKIKTYMYMAAGTIMLALPMLVSTAVATAATPAAPVAGPAACNQISSGIAGGVNQATGTASSSANAVDCSSTIGKAAKTLVNVFSIIVGVVAVVMVIYGGFRYITSGGDSGRVGNAKNSLIYAIVGLVIVALAQVIVHFVLGQTNSIQTNVTAPQ
jgi:uncharacterized membrane protein